MKSAILILNSLCVAAVLSQLLGLAILWYRGQLTSDTLQDLRSALQGVEVTESEIDAGPDEVEVSLEEVIEARARMSADFDLRDAELAVFKEMMTSGAERLTAEQEAFEKRKRAFEEELRAQLARVTDDATEQTRGILLSLPPEDAADQLMQLTVEEDVVLLKGMPEKSIAKILREFKDDGAPVELGKELKSERGRKIFEALSRGEPVRGVLKREQAALDANTNSQPQK